ncbi:MAG: protein kinase domain-containing protein [Kofleriaceae bacterium]
MADDSSEDVVLPGERPEPDDIARRVAKARVAQKLFASDERVRVGRFQLLEKVGAGGMGVVWGAWDPELERRVAIKLVNTTTGARRDRILAEGQALAKLSHPNVVPVFDVGVVDDRVYLVMEWVRGKNLRRWSDEQRRTDRETLAVYRAAGAGLLAAHEAGLVHRDFKPDNAVIGDDGRVRVLDFGLARSETESGDNVGRAGTPKYMAPEQTGGKELTAAADQYAFGISLREALGSEQLPAWVGAIVTRATRPTPAERFPSMAELLAALDRDPRIVWRRRILVGVALAGAAGAFALGTMRSDHVERCSGGRSEIASTWSASTRDVLVARLRGLGAYGQLVATQLGPELDAYAERWVTASRNACLAADAGELAPTRYELVRGCLARTRAGLAAAHDVLSRVEGERLSDALLAARTLPDPGQCGLEAESSTVPPPPLMLAARAAELANDVARARVLALAVDPTAVSVAETTANAAARLGYAPLAARAQLAYGIALLWQKERGRAADVLDRAQSQAFAAGDTRTGVEAFARELWAVGSSGAATLTAKAAIDSARVVENLARGLGPTGAFERALLLNNLGTLRMAKDDRDGARAYFHAALDARPAVIPEHYELASIPANLALVEDDPARRAAWFEQQRTELVAIVGEDNPLVLDVRAAAAAFAIDPAVARAELHVVGERVHRLHPHLADRFAWVAYDLFWLAFDAGDIPRATQAHKWLSAGTELDIASAYLRSSDDPAGAIAAVTPIANDLGGSEQPWLRWRAIDAWIVIAHGERQLGHGDRARVAATRGLELAKTVGPFSRTMFYRQRLWRLEALARQ